MWCPWEVDFWNPSKMAGERRQEEPAGEGARGMVRSRARSVASHLHRFAVCGLSSGWSLASRVFRWCGAGSQTLGDDPLVPRPVPFLTVPTAGGGSSCSPSPRLPWPPPSSWPGNKWALRVRRLWLREPDRIRVGERRGCDGKGRLMFYWPPM